MRRPSIRRALRRLHREQPKAAPEPSAGPTWQVMPGGVGGCRFCKALRELLSFEGMSDFPRYQRLFREGGCFIALPGPHHTRIEAGDDFSLFKMTDPVNDPGPDGVPVVWFRNEDMAIDGSNRRPPGGGAAP